MKKNTEFVYSLNDIALQDNKESYMRYIRNWYWFAILGGIGIVLGFLNYKTSPAVYEVESKILIKGNNNPLQSSISIDNVMGNSMNSNMANQLEILQSFSNYKRALENLNWRISWYVPTKRDIKEIYNVSPLEVFEPADAKNYRGAGVNITILNKDQYKINIDTKVEVYGIEKDFVVDETLNFGEPFKNEFYNFTIYNKGNATSGEYIFYFNNMNRLAQNYLKKVKVEVTDINSNVIKMVVAGVLPNKEADFLNELNKVFITLGVEEDARSSETSVSFISDQLGKIKDSLDRSEQVFTDYRRKNKVVDLSQEANFIYQKLQEIETEKYEANTRLSYYKNLQGYLNSSDDIKKISSPSMVGIDDSNLSSMLQKLTELYNRKELLSYSVNENSPSYILVEKEINLIKNSLLENLNNLISNTESEIAGINRRNAEIQGRLQQLPKTEKDLIGIQREFELNNTMYNYMLKKKAEAELSQASSAPKVQIIDKALPEAAIQVGPSMMKSVGIGLGSGLFIPFLLLYLLEAFSTKIRSKEEVEMLTDMNILDGIIMSKSKKLLPVIDYPRSGLAESFRGLRYNIKNLVHDRDKAVISLNSMMPGEGKSFIASNLAAIISMTDKKVLLVGGDIRKPKLEAIFGDKKGEGLSTFLSENRSIDDVYMETEYPNLYFVPAGEIPPNPTELLENGKIDEFLKQAKRKFDYVVFDNAPFSLVSDGMIISSLADISLFVVRVNETKRKAIKEIQKIVEINKLANTAIVMNATEVRGLSKGYVKKGYGEYREKKQASE